MVLYMIIIYCLTRVTLRVVRFVLLNLQFSVFLHHCLTFCTFCHFTVCPGLLVFTVISSNFYFLQLLWILMYDIMFYALCNQSWYFIAAVVVVIVWQLDLQLPLQSVPITTKVVSANPTKVYSIQHYVITVASDLRQVGHFHLVSSTNKTNRHDIIEILLKVALDTIAPLGCVLSCDLFINSFTTLKLKIYGLSKNLL